MTEDFTKTRRRSCFLLCISLLVVFATVLGFLAGLFVGGILAEHGDLTSVLNQGETVPGPVCPAANTLMTDGSLDPSTTLLSEECPESSNTTRAEGCGECGEARLLLVSGASYADCDGVYSLTNLTSVWDSKHIVYSRLAGGDNRYI